MQKQNTFKILLIVTLIFAGIALFGIGLGFLYSSLPNHHPEKNQQSCENVGGEWSNEQQTCFLSNKKTGEMCTDGGQCISGICFPPKLSEKQEIDISDKPIENITGTCYPDELVTGCIPQVVKGSVSKESMCSNE